MKKRMKSYYGWFPALFLLTLFCCLPKTVSALRASQPQENPPVMAAVPETPEVPAVHQTEAPDPDSAENTYVPEQHPERATVSQPTQAPEDVPEDSLEEPTNGMQPDPDPLLDETFEETPQNTPTETAQQDPDAASEVSPSESEQMPLEEVSSEALSEYFSDTLFIGDSRTVGLCEYSGLNTATFFADVGMSVYKVLKNEVSVPGLGQMTLEKLLQQKTFGKVHLMLGINELGYDLNTTVSAYTTVMDTIRAIQPDAVIYLGANLHVGKSRSDTDTVINNPAIDRFNNAVSALADGETVFYVDVNPLFDDENGNLRTDCSGDGTHVYGSCYPQWAQWLYAAMQTAE